MAILSIVGTPIGHLEDFTFRAQRTLTAVAVIACEDTRVTRKLLDHYKISTPTVSIHQHSRQADLSALLDRVVAGENVAYVSDAGMPNVSDPGGELVALAQARGIKIEVVPGPSALTAALAVAGLPTEHFLYLGFLPHKKGRQTLFRRIAETEEAVVLFESPHRLLKTLEALASQQSERKIAVCRELTKIHESVVRHSAADVLKHFQTYPDQVRGEIVIVIAPK